MLSGEKKKYSPYLDTGLMEEVTRQAGIMGISTNEYIALALKTFIEKMPSLNVDFASHWSEKILCSPEMKNTLTKEIEKILAPED